MSHTIPEIALEANELYTALAGDLDITINLPELVVSTEFPAPNEAGNPAYELLPRITVDDLTTASVSGTGVFDVMMRAVTAQVTEQFEKGRITGADFAKTFLGAMTAVMEFGTSFLINKDRAYLENLKIQEEVKASQILRITALANLEIARTKIQQSILETAMFKFKAHTNRNEYATSKMELVDAYHKVNTSEEQLNLLFEQIDAARAQTKETLANGQSIGGLLALDKQLKSAQAETAGEALDTARAQTKETLKGGGAILGLVAIEKLTKEAQRRLVEEQVETARASTWETHVNGTPIEGIAKYEKELKQAQSKLVLEQYEAQRGQTRGTLSTGEAVIGLVGAQTRLYEQQIISYKRDAETKGLKMVMDSWIARKTIDEGVAVPSIIDTPSLNLKMTTFMANLAL
ncbi:MAG: hypothetical protein ACOH2T_19310 [Pseudomonas sp.]